MTGPRADPQTLLMRRVLGGVAVVVILLILFFGIRACGDARQSQAFQDYVADVGDLVSESNQQGQSLFTLLEDPGTQTSVDVQNSVNGLRVEAEQLVERARGIDAPDELGGAQQHLIETLGFRADGLRGIADELPAALGDQSNREAALAMAGQMQNLLASDVIYSQRVIPEIQTAAREAGVLDRLGTLPESKFLPDVRWLTEREVIDALEVIRSGSGADRTDEPASPGLHGTGLQGVVVQPGGDELVEDGTTAVSESPDLAFDVEVQNQGENDEEDIPVRISIGGPTPIDLSSQIEQIGEGETVAVTIPVTEELPTNTDLPVEVEVEGVPGEESLDNNRGKYLIRVGS